MKSAVVLALALAVVCLASLVQPMPQQRVRQNRRPPGRSTNPNQNAANLINLDLPDGDLRKVSKDTRIENLTKDVVDKLMKNEESINVLTRCFKVMRTCKSPAARQMIGQLGNIGSGTTGCNNCSPAQIQNRNEVIFYFLAQFRDRYPRQYRQVLNEIPAILASLRS